MFSSLEFSKAIVALSLAVAIRWHSAVQDSADADVQNQHMIFNEAVCLPLSSYREMKFGGLLAEILY